MAYLEDIEDKNHTEYIDTDVTDANFRDADIRGAALRMANLTQSQIDAAGKRDLDFVQLVDGVGDIAELNVDSDGDFLFSGSYPRH